MARAAGRSGGQQQKQLRSTFEEDARSSSSLLGEAPSKIASLRPKTVKGINMSSIEILALFTDIQLTTLKGIKQLVLDVYLPHVQ